MSQQFWNLTIYSDSFIFTIQQWFINLGCNEYAYNIDIKHIPFEICSIHKPTHLQFTVLVVELHLQKKKKKEKSDTV